MIDVMGKEKEKLNSHQKELIISSDLDNLNKVEKFNQKICHQVGLSDEQCDNMAIALTELAINSIMHGNKEDKSKKVKFHAVIKDDRIEVSILDEGSGFDPEKLPNPTNPQNIWKEHGRGIFLVQNLIDEVNFEKTPEGMKITLTEYLQKKKSTNL
jgi:serine/threonine-protein kinase RsbW